MAKPAPKKNSPAPPKANPQANPQAAPSLGDDSLFGDLTASLDADSSAIESKGTNHGDPADEQQQPSRSDAPVRLKHTPEEDRKPPPYATKDKDLDDEEEADDDPQSGHLDDLGGDDSGDALSFADEDSLDALAGDEGSDSADEDAARVIPLDGTFDIDKAIGEIKELKNSPLRKQYVTVKAKYEQAAAQLKDTEEELARRNDELDALQNQYKTRVSEVREVPLKEYPPYQELAREYEKRVNETKRSFRRSSSQKALEQLHERLRIDFVSLQSLEGEEFDKKREEFDQRVQDAFGDDANSVYRFVENAYDLEMRAGEVTAEYNRERSSSSLQVQKKRYNSYKKDIQKLHGDYFTRLSDEDIEKSPFTLRAYVKKLLEGSEGRKVERMIKKDLDSAVRVFGGIEPFDPEDERWRGMDPDVARDTWVEEFENLEKVKNSRAIEIFMDGLMAQRINPHLLRKLYEYERTSTKPPRAGTPSTRSNGAAPRKSASPDQEMRDAEAEYQKAMQKLNF